MKKLGMVWLVLALVLAGCKEEKDNKDDKKIDISKGRNDCEKRELLLHNARAGVCEKNKSTNKDCECFLQGKDLGFDEVSKQTVCVAVEADDRDYSFLNPLQGAEPKCEGKVLESSSLCLNNLTQCSNCAETRWKETVEIVELEDRWGERFYERWDERYEEQWQERRKQIYEEQGPTDSWTEEDWERVNSEWDKLREACEAELKEEFPEEWETLDKYYKFLDGWEESCGAYFYLQEDADEEAREEQMTGSE